MSGSERLLVLIGPTALGKTAIAVAAAERLGAEIVSADSMQVYRGLGVLTNQPTVEERRRVRHHLVGHVDPRVEYSAAAYAVEAQATIDRLRAARTPVVLEGGGGLYVRAALGGLGFGTAARPGTRRELEERLRTHGLAALVDELKRRDQLTAARIDLANPRRVVRALEIIRSQEAPLTAGQYGHLWQPPAHYPSLIVTLDEDRTLVRERVDERVRAMIAGGALDEVRRLLASGEPSRTVAQAIGVRELSRYLAGTCGLDEAVGDMQARTRRLVRRQLTWMRKLPDTARIAVLRRAVDAVAEEVVALLHSTER